MATSFIFQRVQEAVRRCSGSYVSALVEARMIPNMGVGIVAKDAIPKDTLVFQAGTDAWYPFSAECALNEAQKKAPGFLQQVQQLVASNPSFQTRSSFVPNALILGVHLLVNFQHSPMPQISVNDVKTATLGDLYINALPNFVDLPFYWDDKQLQELEACQEARRAIQQGNRFYTQVFRHLFGNGNALVTSESFFWAISILMSRATSGQNQPFTLIPFFDWFNHADNGDECVHGFDSQSGFTVYTTRAYNPGEQLFINYGHHSNLRLLRNYGFTSMQNPYDVIELALPAPLQQLRSDDPEYKAKNALLCSLQLGQTAASNPDISPVKKTIALNSDGHIDENSHQWLQVQLASSEELQALFQQASSPEEMPSTSSSNHVSLRLPSSLVEKVHARILSIANERLKQHKSTIESDERFLSAHDRQMARWFKSCLHIRIGEKAILTNAVATYSPQARSTQ